MNEWDSRGMGETPSSSISADAMLKRIFGVANILITVKQQQDVKHEASESDAENHHQRKLHYREAE